MNTVIVAVLVTLLVFVDCQQRCGRNGEECGEDECCPMLGWPQRCRSARGEGDSCSLLSCCGKELHCVGLPMPRRCRRVGTTTPEDITDLPTVSTPEDITDLPTVSTPEGSTLDETESK